MSLSIIIPVFNSEHTLEEVITRIVKVMSSEKLLYEIILIDDASTDNSWEKVINLAKKNQNIMVMKFLKEILLFFKLQQLVLWIHHIPLAREMK